MNNEPVAWAYIKDGEFWDAIHPDEHAQEEGSYTIPLYTHPHPDNLGLAESIIKQQQAEIEALKEELDKQGKIIPFTESEIKYSKPQFPDKPVAWMLTDRVVSSVPMEGAIPLYTHPVKELGGVEIIGMSGKYDFTYEVDIIDFARAILRKAQSK